MDYKVMSLTNPHTIRGTPTLKDVERFRDGNGSFREFCRLKALVTLKEVNASDAKKRKNEQNFDDEIKKQQANRRKFNSPVQQHDSFPFFMMLDTCDAQFDISYIMIRITSLACFDTSEKSALK